MTILRPKLRRTRILDHAFMPVRDLCRLDADACLARLGTPAGGLDAAAADASRELYGPNVVDTGKAPGVSGRLKDACVNPFTLILAALALMSVATDIVFPLYGLFGRTMDDFDCATSIVIGLLIAVSCVMRFVEESRSATAVADLMVCITTTVTVVRDGAPIEIDPADVVVGDLLDLHMGDIVAADARVVASNNLSVNQAGLTGETRPVLKDAVASDAPAVLGLTNLVLAGTDVVTGCGTAVVVAVGANTVSGSSMVQAAAIETHDAFNEGVASVSRILVRFMLVMVPIVVVVNGLTKGDWLAAVLFGATVAVGLTPEMLPMVVTSCLSKGARVMAKRRVVIKSLDAIQSLGAMDVLCTDKTGTLTAARITLDACLAPDGSDTPALLPLALANATLAGTYGNELDAAIVAAAADKDVVSPAVTADAAFPFDFNYKRATVVADGTVVCKGAVAHVLELCDAVDFGTGPVALDAPARARVDAVCEARAGRGYRLVAVATKPAGADLSREGCEAGLTLVGFLSFMDEPKLSAARAVSALASHGVRTVMLTGDSPLVSATIASKVGIASVGILTGSELESLTDAELACRLETVSVCAALAPLDKARVIRVLKASGHTVGFMGDGVNDAPALRQADVGVSVDTACDIAKAAASVVLLENDLAVLDAGILEGRRTYANMLKYIKMTAASNFGNVMSVLAASVFLPFLPMASIQLLLLNLVYDVCCSAIPFDRVDEAYVTRPRTWDAGSIATFMLRMGPVSTVFDLLTFAVLYFVVCPAVAGGGALYTDLPALLSGHELVVAQLAYVGVFQAGWFVESMWTQTLVIHLVRTDRVPFVQSRASLSLALSTLAGIVVLTALPFTPAGASVGLAALPALFFVALAPIIAGYLVSATWAKRRYIRRFGTLL